MKLTAKAPTRFPAKVRGSMENVHSSAVARAASSPMVSARKDQPVTLF